MPGFTIVHLSDFERPFPKWALARKSLGLQSFGMNVVELPPGETIPEHTEVESDQEEVFIILSGDADFTPVLIRLRAHARRTVIFANEFTAAPYTAICDGEVRETSLIELILAGELPDSSGEELPGAAPKSKIEDARRAILAEVVAGVRASAAPVPLEALADRALRALGHEKTIATGWAGAGSFRELLRRNLPEEIRLTGEPPYLAFDAKRHLEEPAPRVALEAHDVPSEIAAPGSAAQIAAAGDRKSVV